VHRLPGLYLLRLPPRITPGLRRAGSLGHVCCVSPGLALRVVFGSGWPLRRGFRRLMQRGSGGMAAPGIKEMENEGPWPSPQKMEVRGARMRRDA
jgi:hypothetical protein